MTNEQRLKNLSVPNGKIDVILDTDAFNEVDDQFAIAYLLAHKEKLNTVAIYAAPFLNYRVESAEEGMEKSYHEILNVLELAKEKRTVFRGSREFLPDETTPVISDAAQDLAKRCKNYSPENPLYVVAIGAITNVASAILINPQVTENTVVVWLGGHAHHYHDTNEFNLRQDIAASRVVIKSGVPFVQLPCRGVVSEFSVSRPDLECWFRGKNELTNYLTDMTIREREEQKRGDIWVKVIWDVVAVAWLINDNDRFMLSRVIKAPLPSYDCFYEEDPDGYPMCYVYSIMKAPLLKDMIEKLTK